MLIYFTGIVISGSFFKVNITPLVVSKYTLVLNLVIIQYLLFGYDNTSVIIERIQGKFI